MRKLTKSFQKRQSIASRVLCFLLVLAMVVTMVPALGGGNSTVQAAETEKNLTIHFMMPSNWGWTTPAVQFWGGTYAVSGNTNIENTDGTEINRTDANVAPGKNMAVDSGTIEITNKLNEYKLPETGGSGNRWLYMLSGVVLIAIATITLFYKKQKVL